MGIGRQHASRTAIVMVAAMSVAASAACGSAGGGGGGGGKGIPDTVKLQAIYDRTGLGAVSARFQERGMRLAIKEINDQNFLGKSNLTVSVKDTTFDPQVAATDLSQAVTDRSVVAVLGPLNSGEAAAMAPIANKGRLPTLVQTGASGIDTGQYVFQTTAPFAGYYDKGLAYLQAQQVKTVSVIYASDSQTYADVARKTVPAGVAKYGYKVLSNAGVPSTTTDFTASVSRVLDDHPDAVVLSTFATGVVTIAKSLRQNGYKGIILANSAASAGALKAAGSAGVGVVWPNDFSYASTDPNAQKFVKSYEAAYGGEPPADWAASSYDGVWMIARAIKASGDASRGGIRTGLATVAKSGFTGAEGKITFNGNVFDVPGLLVRWDGTAEKEIAAP